MKSETFSCAASIRRHDGPWADRTAVPLHTQRFPENMETYVNNFTSSAVVLLPFYMIYGLGVRKDMKGNVPELRDVPLTLVPYSSNRRSGHSQAEYSYVEEDFDDYS